MNSCGKSIHIVKEAVESSAVDIVGRLWRVPLIASFHQCGPYMVIHWHIHVMHLRFFYVRVTV